jgi:hypothetical protein
LRAVMEVSAWNSEADRLLFTTDMICLKRRDVQTWHCGACEHRKRPASA